MQADRVSGRVTLHHDGKGPVGYGELHTDVPVHGMISFYIPPSLIRRFVVREDDQLTAHVQSPRGWHTRWHLRQLIAINGQDAETVRRERQSDNTQSPTEVS
jgi:transcription termination factor Rho